MMIVCQAMLGHMLQVIRFLFNCHRSPCLEVSVEHLDVDFIKLKDVAPYIYKLKDGCMN